MNKQAIKRIVLAQVASDGGKYIRELVDEINGSLKEPAQKAWDRGYQIKDILLEQACKIVARHHDNDIRFFVTKDKQGVAKFIVYFDIKINDKKWQASFHSFSASWAKWEQVSVPSRGHWDHKDSRETCRKLLTIL